MKAEVKNINGKQVMEIIPETPFDYVQAENWLKENTVIKQGYMPHVDVMSFDIKLMEK